jgi:hypothetical protein
LVSKEKYIIGCNKSGFNNDLDFNNNNNTEIFPFNDKVNYFIQLLLKRPQLKQLASTYSPSSSTPLE